MESNSQDNTTACDQGVDAPSIAVEDEGWITKIDLEQVKVWYNGLIKINNYVFLIEDSTISTVHVQAIDESLIPNTNVVGTTCRSLPLSTAYVICGDNLDKNICPRYVF